MNTVTSINGKINNINKLALISFFSSLYFYTPVVTLYYQQRGLNLIQINSLWGIIVGTMFFAEVPTGILADKMGRKQSVILALALQLSGEVIYIFARSYWVFAGISIIAGIGFSFSSGSVEAMIYDALKQEGRESEMQKVMGQIGSSAKLANIIAPVIGGIITVRLTEQRFVLAIIFTAVSVSLGLFAAFFLHEEKTGRFRTEQSSILILSESIKQIVDNCKLRKIILLSLLTTPFLNYLLNFYQPYFIIAQVPLYLLGPALSAGAIIAYYGEKNAWRLVKKLGGRVSILLVSILPGILYLLASLILHPILSVIVFCLLYGSMSIRTPVFSSYYNRCIDSSSRATVLSVISMFSGIYIALMGLVIGFIGDISVRIAFVVMGGIVIASSLFLRLEDTYFVN